MPKTATLDEFWNKKNIIMITDFIQLISEKYLIRGNK